MNNTPLKVALISLYLSAIPSCATTVATDSPNPMLPDSTTSVTLLSGSTRTPKRPNPTPRVTPEDEFPPYLTPTPLIPMPQQDAEYVLAEWGPKQADETITDLLEYPEGLSDLDRFYHDEGYFLAFGYALDLLEESLSLNPDSEFSSKWIWELGFQKAQIGDDDVSQYYAELLTEALNSGKTQPTDLPLWFVSNEPRLELSITETQAPLGYKSADIIEISNDLAGIFLFLLGSPSGYEVFPLASEEDFGFAHRAGIEFSLVDLTGDGNREIITTHRHQRGVGEAFTSTHLDIFNLAITPPRKIEFKPSGPLIWGTTWSVINDKEGTPILLFEFVYDEFLCEMPIYLRYQWDGRNLSRTSTSIPWLEEAEIGDELVDDFARCADITLSILLDQAMFGDSAAGNLIDDLFSNWPFADIEPITHEEYPVDAFESLQYELALFSALNGNIIEAKSRMTKLMEMQDSDSNHWIERARVFTEYYIDADHLSIACQMAGGCFPILTIRELLSTALPEVREDVIGYLRDVGVNVVHSGSIQIKDSGQSYLWFTEDQERKSYDWDTVWLVDMKGDEIEAWRVGIIDAEQSPNFYEISSNLDSPIIRIESDSYEEIIVPGSSRYSAGRILKLDDYVYGIFWSLEEALLAGEDPSFIAEELEDLLTEPLLECESISSDGGYSGICTPIRYYLGLSYELAGDVEAAAQTYLDLWRMDPFSPRAIVAMSKLQISR